MLSRIVMEEFCEHVKRFETVFEEEVSGALDDPIGRVPTLLYTELHDIGMTGNQLELKRSLIFGLIDRACKFFSHPTVKKIIGGIKKAFGAINNIEKSDYLHNAYNSVLVMLA